MGEMASDLDPAARELLGFFKFEHLPEGMMRHVSSLFAELAGLLPSLLGSGREGTAGLRKLLEAKDCCVRQALLDLQEVQDAE